MPKPLIKLENIHKQFQTEEIVTKVLHGVNLEIQKGEFVAIMGPSGSGKSTLMNIMGFLDIPTTGKYYYEGKDVSQLEDDRLAEMRSDQIGFIFQAFNLLPRTSVFENVMMPLMYTDIDKKDRIKMVKDSIEAVELTHRINNLSNQLSGGEKQRVAIARALVNYPSVIFADEPTGNLDSKSGLQVMRLLQDLNIAEGHTIVLVTHEKYTAEHAQRIIKIKDGLIESDSAVKHRQLAGENGELKK